MKCLCPLEDRECPGNCSSKERAKRRKIRAEELYSQGVRVEQIAAQLSVTKGTISKDLAGVVSIGNNSEPRTSKRGRKGEGRPKSSTPKAKPSKPRPAEHHAAAAKALDEGKSRVTVAAETGLSEHQVQLSRERELGRREVFKELLDTAAAKNYSEKGTVKIEDAIRIHKTRLNKQFEQQVNEEVRRRIVAADDATRASNKELRQEILGLQRLIQQRGIFTETQFKQLLMLCHPDNSASPQVKAELLQIILKHKAILVRPETVKVVA